MLLGFVDDANARVLEKARELLPGMEVVPVRIAFDVFESALGSFGNRSRVETSIMISSSPIFRISSNRDSPASTSLISKADASGVRA